MRHLKQAAELIEDVTGEKSSRVTKVPLAELRRLFVTVKVVGVHREEGQEEEGEKQGEVEREVEQLKDNRTCTWCEDGMTDSRDLEPSGM